jgi:hypothetical protein
MVLAFVGAGLTQTAASTQLLMPLKQPAARVADEHKRVCVAQAAAMVSASYFVT